MNLKAKELLDILDTDYALITNPMNVFYFTGAKLDPHERLLAVVIDKDKKESTIIYPKLDEETIKKDGTVDHLSPHEDGEDAFQYIFDKIPEGKTVGVEGDHLTYERYKRLIEKYDDKDIKDISNTVNKLRGVKDEDDLEKLKEAVKITEDALSELYNITVEGKTETEIADFLVEEFKKRGAVGPSFGPTVLAGDKSALPHGEPGDRVIKKGDFLLIDFGIVSKDNYVSDMTRTFFIGEPDEKQREIYNSVLNANLAGIKSSTIGTTFSQIDKASRDVIEADGYGEYFTHRVGHGLGHDLHERPSVDDNNHDELNEGNVITIEPGIYIPEYGGVRIEDALFAAEEGPIVLNEFKKDIDGMILK
ncbi:M24 family metallopeptidase [Nosocomiicoccus ampullae]|uniref:M24 family metallopeptidase n=1 Tax=Nosocomiicoccus ampullae TaxID=489910 RepID=UPI00214EBCB4|nr:Xaa-Pro peptidase family protein [Nosocomiicoccus ampullae]